MPGPVKLYVVKYDNGAIDIVATPEEANIHLASRRRVFAIDAVPYEPAPPKETRWTVVDRDGDYLSREDFMMVDSPEDAVSFNSEHDAICMLDILVRGGMTGLKIVKIEGDE